MRSTRKTGCGLRRLFRFALSAATTLVSCYGEPAANDAVPVPMDSWIYPALDRLAGLGFVPSQIAGLRPWSRRECLRQVREAAAILRNREDVEAEAASGIIEELERELTGALGPLVIDSIYTRTGIITGPELNDSFHFGQTWRDDFGRPFGRGWNRISGVTLRMGHGPFFGGLRAEYQGAPGGRPYDEALRRTIATLDRNPMSSLTQVSPVDRFRIVEGELGVRLPGWSVSIGRQSLYWGPGQQSPLSFSNNAEPTVNMKISTDPLRLPGFLARLGVVRGDFVMGKLGGHRYTWRPWFNAQKIAFKLTDNLELGFTRWSLLFGVGHPITWRNLWRNFRSAASGPSMPFDPSDPGDRKAGFDFRWRIPGAQDWLTLYSDSYSDDDPSPLAAPRRAAISPGLWLTRVPWLPKLDLRMEAALTEPLSGDYGGQFIYYNDQYHSGNTNYGFLLGNPVGRDGRSLDARANFWFSARDRIEAGFRQTKIGGQFLAGGGTQSDASVSATLRMKQDWVLSGTVQYERFWIPVLGGPQHNWSGRLQVTWEPEGGFAVWTPAKRQGR